MSTEQNGSKAGAASPERLGSATITLTEDEIVDVFVALRTTAARMKREADEYQKEHSACILRHVLEVGAQMQLDALGVQKLAEKFYALKPNT